ncbi:MAG: creatininase family protein [Terracidiphilus sp.]
MFLDKLTWPEVKELDFSRLVVLLPLGSFEQHGHHLPLTTDTRIVTAIAEAVEAGRRDRILLLPTLWPGHSTHHLAFPGTLSIRQMNYIKIIIDLCGSMAGMGGRKLFLLNGHGGNDIPVRAALREVKTKFGAIAGLHTTFASYWSLAAQTIKEVRESDLGGVSHACEMETSIMLHLSPEEVRMDLARRDGPQHASPYRKADMQAVKPVYFVNEFHELSTTGAIGRPDLATAEKGRRFLDGIVRDVTAFIDDFLTW